MLRILQEDPGIEQMIGLTLNNISCFHKNNGDIIKAEVVLKRALRFQEGSQKSKAGPESQHAGIINIEDVDDTLCQDLTSPEREVTDESALTLLNMCAIYSQKKDHATALKHAQSSINKIEPEIRKAQSDLVQQMQAQEDFRKILSLKEAIQEKQSLCAIAYFNLGCQQEHLRQYHLSMQSYKRALMYEKIRLGLDPEKAVTQQNI